jgi:DNA modification methylase
MIIEKKKISDLIPAPYNPRQSTAKQEKHLKESLEKFGLVEPIIFNKQTGYIVGGHFRVRELKKLGIKEIECVIVDLNEENEKELNIRLNANTGGWDWDTLANDWDVVDLEAWGLDIPQFDTVEELEASEDDYEVPEGGIETDIVIGDLFEIGEHRLLCGDSTDSDAVARLMKGEKADLGHNDPPYGMKKENEGVLNDNLNFDNLLQFNKEWIALQFIHLKDSGSWYCWGIDEPLMDIYSHILKPYIKQQKATFRNLITWFKNPSGLGDGQNNSIARSYGIITEKCLFAMMGVQGFNNNADNYFEGWEPIRDYLLEQRLKAGWDIPTMKRIAGHSDLSRDHWTCKSQWNMPTKEVYLTFQKWCIENNINAFKKEYEELKKEYEELKKEYEELKKEYYSTRAYFNNTHDLMTEVWQFERHLRQGDEGGHATPKPIPLCERVIKSSCPEKGLVLDFFLGSGSTMVASHQLKRKCYGLELEPKYCQVIIDRMRKLDSTLIIKRNGVELKQA